MKNNHQEGEGMNVSKVDLSALEELSKDITKKTVKQDELAVAAYVNQVCEQLKLAGEEIADYSLVRTTYFDISSSTNIQYSIVKKSKL